MDFDPGPTIADGLRLDVVLDYVSESGRATQTVTIHSVHGENWAWPQYVRGWCSRAQALRTFRLDKVVALHLPEHTHVDMISWRLGDHVRRQQGLDPAPPPRGWRPDREVIAIISTRGGLPVRMRGRIPRARFDYYSQGAFLWFEMTVKPETGGRWVTLEGTVPHLGGQRRLLGFFDVEDGAEPDELQEWLDRVSAEREA